MHSDRSMLSSYLATSILREILQYDALIAKWIEALVPFGSILLVWETGDIIDSRYIAVQYNRILHPAQQTT